MNCSSLSSHNFYMIFHISFIFLSQYAKPLYKSHLPNYINQLQIFKRYLIIVVFLQGRAVFASGSPFPACTVNGQTFYPGQGNNAYIFPGVALGVITCGVRHISDGVFLRAAQV